VNGNRAQYVRDVRAGEAEADVVHDAKALTFEKGCEHAVLLLLGGRRVLVRGGPFGIQLERTIENDPFGREPNRLLVEVNGVDEVVERLDFHVHPIPTGGPSDDDLLVMSLLRQDESILYELFGPPEGTTIRPKRRDVDHGT
jgi:hypothetical protein